MAEENRRAVSPVLLQGFLFFRRPLFTWRPRVAAGFALRRNAFSFRPRLHSDSQLQTAFAKSCDPYVSMSSGAGLNFCQVFFHTVSFLETCGPWADLVPAEVQVPTACQSGQSFHRHISRSASDWTRSTRDHTKRADKSKIH